MKLYMPTCVYSEKECVSKHAKELANIGKMAMIVTGRNSSKKNGSLQAVEDALQAHKTAYCIFDQIEENPSIETVMAARDRGIKEKVDYVIGVGGGSPMDAAKAIALMIANPDKGESLLYEDIPAKALPVAEVPTTAGTGSEVTPYAILTIHAQKTKKSINHKIYPRLALIDPVYLKTSGRNGFVATTVDTLAHLVESYLNTNADAYNRVYSEAGLRIFGELKTKIMEERIGDKELELLSQACVLGGMAITHTGTSLPHGLSYPITYEMGVAHGKACGLFLAGYVEIYQDKKASSKVLELLGFRDSKEMKHYLNELLGSVEIPEELKKSDVAAILSNQAKLKNYPYPITEVEMYKMF